MISVCLYFHVHQPFRLRRDYSFFHIGTDHFYEDDKANREILDKVAAKCYLPANELMLRLIDRYKGRFRVAYSVTGVMLEQFEKYNPAVLESFRRLDRTGCVEFVTETYYHSLAFLFSRTEFREQVILHRKKLKSLFGNVPPVFRNTELIYNDELGDYVSRMGFKTLLTEGADQVLGWRSPNYLYQGGSGYKLNLLLKNYRLSDDIAFRFSNTDWAEHPLTADKYASWLHAHAGNGEVLNLFMDYETFGEHQWSDTGIFGFLEDLPSRVLANTDFRFLTPSEVPKRHPPLAKLSVPYYISWADLERDLTAWLGNPLQDSAIKLLYGLERSVKKSADPDLISVWRKLQTSDHFYYMCTKWFSDGDVHKYFNPYSSPYEAFSVYMNVLNDLIGVLRKRGIEAERLYRLKVLSARTVHPTGARTDGKKVKKNEGKAVSPAVPVMKTGERKKQAGTAKKKVRRKAAGSPRTVKRTLKARKK